MANDIPTALKTWLSLNRLTCHQLAKRLNVSPHTVKKFANGDFKMISTPILKEISIHTGLTYEQLIEPAAQQVSPTETGDSRFDIALGLIARYLHTPEMVRKCRKYFSLDFTCKQNKRNQENTPSINYDEMCALNSMQSAQINSLLLSTCWYDPDCKSHDSRLLFTYWRAIVVVPSATQYNDTFIVLEFEKSVNEMGLLDIPIIKSWWWDVSEELNKVNTEFNSVSMTVPDDQSLKRFDQCLAA